MSVQSADFISDIDSVLELLSGWESWSPEMIPIIKDLRSLRSRAMGGK